MPMVRTLSMVAALSALLLSGCVVAPYAPHGQPAQVYEDEGPLVEVAPPPPRVEVIPVLPYAGAVWLGGYWGWGGGRHHWVPGRWDRPRAGFYWVPHRWLLFQGRWQLRGGWRRG